MRRPSQVSFCITLHESEKRDRSALAPTFVALALLLIRSAGFAPAKLDSSLKEFELFFSCPSRAAFIYRLSHPLNASRTKILNSSNKYTKERENCAGVSKKR